MIRKILGVVAGVVVAFVLVALLEMVVNYALAPAGIDPSDAEGMKAMMAAMPAKAFIAILLTYFVATLAGGFTAARISREQWGSWAVAGVVLAATLLNVVLLPHPLWFTVAAVAMIGAAGWFGGRLALGASGAAGQGRDSGDAGYGGSTGDGRDRHDGLDDGGGDSGGDGGGD